MTRPMLAMTLLVWFVRLAGLASAATPAQQPPSSESGLTGLWVDESPSYSLLDVNHTWRCSMRGWTYLSTRAGSATTGTIACTTPAGNDLSWAGGRISDVKLSGNQVSFDRPNGVFGNSLTGCHVTATLTAEGIRGTQTCKLRYKSPLFNSTTSEATVTGPYHAERVAFAGPELTNAGCGRERTPRSGSLAAGALILLENRTQQDFTVYLVALNGRLVTPGSPLPGGGTFVEPVPANTPLVLTDSQGRCRAVYLPGSEPAKAIVQ